ncbi:HAD family hydrolase [Gluconacetobacter sp. Hr-1-5]|uniref:HAD family hydrolase n=1 Tax=Gluconacetobacter sp. Hr-1-5 TaxID=3395370 RepID=UPI003B52AAB0
MKNVDIVSFDVFDTLLVRPVFQPTDVFLFMERQTGIAGFHDARIIAEQDARSAMYAASKTNEVTLSQIYDALQIRGKSLTAGGKAELMGREIEIEAAFLTRSPRVGALYDLAVSMGKTIIAISDMYHSSAVIGRFLAQNGFRADRIFVSCEHHASKHEGDLYGIAAREMKVAPGQILHFGDNFHSDGSAALEAGVAGYFLPSIGSQLCQDHRFNQRAISQLHEAAVSKSSSKKNLFASVVLAYLARFKAEQPMASMAEHFGGMYGGPLVSGFAIWLNTMQRVDNVRHLWLATRDGYITKSVWERLGFDPNAASILHSSRRLTMMPALYSAFEKEIASLLNTGTTCTMQECIERLDLGEDSAELLKVLKRFVALDRPIDTPMRAKAALNALKNSSSRLKSIAKKEKEAYEQYLKAEGFDPACDAFVDCGWALSSQRRMERMLGETFRGYYIGSLDHAYLHEHIREFLFHKGEEKAWVTIAERGVELLELPFSSTNLQICRFEPDAKSPSGVRPVPIQQAEQYDLVRRAFICKMHEQIEDFADFIKPFIDVMPMEELQKGLFVLFDSLVNHPTEHEYHGLAILPHNRELGASGFATVGTFWQTGGTHYQQRQQQSRWKDYMRLGMISLRQNGFRLTWATARRVLRRKLSRR